MAKIIDFATLGGDKSGESAKKSAKAQAKAPEERAADIKLYHLRVTLVDSEPPIWRDVVVPRDFTLQMLHETILTLFEWSGYHLYFFENERKKTVYDDPAGPPSDFGYPEGEKHFPADEHTVKELLPRKGSRARYVYDLGDFWDIELEVLQTRNGDELPFPLIPLCLAGEMASPLEDVGGMGGWYGFCLSMDDPDDPRRAELADWAGFDEVDVEEFDERTFSPRDANAEFAAMQVRAFPDALPSDPDELRELCIHLMADNMALEVDNMLLLGDSVEAMMEMASFFGVDDEQIFQELGSMIEGETGLFPRS